MGNNGDTDESAAHDGSGDLHCPLPGVRNSVLGSYQGWPESLKAYSRTVACLAHPAAIFWGDHLIQLHNSAWVSAGAHGVQALQGHRQRAHLKSGALRALTSVGHSGKPEWVDAGDLMGTQNKQRNIVLISALSEDDAVACLLVQQLPDLQPQNLPEQQLRERVLPRQADKEQTDPSESGLDISKLGTVADNAPLDQHPFFRRFAEMLPSGLAILDHKARAVFVNQQFYALTTHEGDDQNFTSWPQIIHEDDYNRVMDAYREAFESQQQLRTEFRAVCKKNPWRLLLLTPLGNENLEHVSLREYGGFICNIVDISSQKSRELAGRQAAKEADKHREQQARFTDMISHEIRNPLSAILYCAEDVEDAIQHSDGRIDVAAIHEAVETIKLCISHQRRIIDDVLNLSKLDSDMLSLTPKSCQPSVDLAATLKMFQAEFRKNSVKHDFRIDKSYADLEVNWVTADMTRIAQVLTNLLTNALKFTAHSQGEKSVTISIGASLDRPTSYPAKVVFFDAEADDSKTTVSTNQESGNGKGTTLYIMVAVKDTGIGITDEGHKQLFERFRQATPETCQVYGGSGLGLNISRKLCHLHGGEIGTASKEGMGSTFSFFFQVRRADEPEDNLSQRDTHQEKNVAGGTRIVKAKNGVISKEANPRKPSTSAESSDFQQNEGLLDGRTDSKSEPESQTSVGADALQHRRLLLVEDNAINQQVVSRRLEKQGFRVTTVNNGFEALGALKSAPKPSSCASDVFKIVLMDQEMPHLDGNSTTQAIRELEGKGELEYVPILGVTSNARGTRQEEMLASGIDDIIAKPYDVVDLVDKIEGLLRPRSDGKAT